MSDAYVNFTEPPIKVVQQPAPSFKRVGWIRSDEGEFPGQFIGEHMKAYASDVYDTPVFVQLYEQAELDKSDL